MWRYSAWGLSACVHIFAKLKGWKHRVYHHIFVHLRNQSFYSTNPPKKRWYFKFRWTFITLVWPLNALPAAKSSFLFLANFGAKSFSFKKRPGQHVESACNFHYQAWKISGRRRHFCWIFHGRVGTVEPELCRVKVRCMWTQDIWGLFVLIDADHNGVVDIDEFVNGALKQKHHMTEWESERKVRFMKMDELSHTNAGFEYSMMMIFFGKPLTTWVPEVVWIFVVMPRVAWDGDWRWKRWRVMKPCPSCRYFFQVIVGWYRLLCALQPEFSCLFQTETAVE